MSIKRIQPTTPREAKTLRTALKLWHRELTPQGYPESAVRELMQAIEARPAYCLNQAEREMAVTALEKMSGLCPHDEQLKARLETDHHHESRTATPPNESGRYVWTADGKLVPVTDLVAGDRVHTDGEFIPSPGRLDRD